MPRFFTTERAQRPRRKGVALLMAMVVVLLLTTFVGELTFSTGLEMRAMTTFKEAYQARGLARSVFKAVRIGLLMEEVSFFEGYDQLQLLLVASSVPWDEGLLLDLEITPLDHLYSVNEFANQRPNTDMDKVRYEIFYNTLIDLEIESEFKNEDEEEPPEPIAEEVIQGLYAAIWDWMDMDEEEYLAFPGVNGAESSAYFSAIPEVNVKNNPLDLPTELRMIKGVLESRIPWDTWMERFTVLPKRSGLDFYFQEKINVNTATRDEIVEFLERHKLTSPLTDSGKQLIQDKINKYVGSADAIADVIVPEEAEDRKALKMAELITKMNGVGGGVKGNYAKYLFSTANSYYRVRLKTEVAQVTAELQGVLKVSRNPDTRIGSKVEVLWQVLN